MSIFNKVFHKNEELVVNNNVDCVIKNDNIIPDFSSDSIVSIDDNHVLDTSNPISIAKYKSNLRIIVDKVKNNGFVNKLVIIRNDSFLPQNWEWFANSKNIAFEKNNLPLSYEIRKNMVSSKLENDSNLDFHQEMLNIDKNIGNVLLPVKFRSTKHFTVNTPLGFTGNYNFVDSNRDYTIIDDISNFLESGYAYSLSINDAYIDVTHESLKISDNAIVLISNDKFNAIKNDKILLDKLKERNLYVYKGDISLAICMLLSQNGILPFRPGSYYEFDQQLISIIENTIIILSSKYNLLYNYGHGNILGKGGHFTDMLDGLNNDYFLFKQQFVDFISNKFSLNMSSIDDHDTIDYLIKRCGTDNLLMAIDEFNNKMFNYFNLINRDYLCDRKNITESDSYEFKHALYLINKFYLKNGNFKEINEDLGDLIKKFFHSDRVSEQLSAARDINMILNVYDDINIAKSV